MKNSKLNILEGDIKSVLYTLSLPIILSNFLQTMLNMVDMIWVGKLGSDAVSAVGTASFYLNVSMALTTLVCIGTGVKIAHALGARKHQDSQVYIKNAMFISMILAILFCILMALFIDPLIGYFELNNVLIETMTKEYLLHSLIGVPVMFLVMLYTTVYTSYGQTKITFVANAVGLVFNIISDPLFIFGFGSFNGYGVAGAAIATNISRIFTLILLVYYSNEDIKQSFKVKLNLDKMKEVLHMSYPVTLQRLIFIYIGMIMAKLIISFGVEAIAVQKIGIQIESISYVTIGGLQGSIAAFIGQNYGNQNYDRIHEGFKISVRYVFIFSLFITAAFYFFPEAIFSVFIKEPDAIKEGANYLRILSISQLFMCIELLTVGAFNGIGRTFIPPIATTILTAIRIPIGMYLSKIYGLSGVWWSITISSILKGAVLYIWFKIDSRNLEQRAQKELA